MLQDCSSVQGPEILLTDGVLERALILKILLNMACNNPDQFDWYDPFDILDLIKLAEKFDCVTPLQTISLYSKRMGESMDLSRGRGECAGS